MSRFRTLPRSFVERYTEQLHNLTSVAQSKLAGALAGLNVDSPNFRTSVASLFEYYAHVSAEAAAEIAAAFYRGASAYLTGEVPDVMAISDFVPDAARAAAYAIEDSTASKADMTSQLGRALGYQINSAAGRASRNCGKQDKRNPTFARVPTGAETCAWCITTAGLGFHYMSKETASHTHSNCVVAETRVSGTGLLASMRREYEGPLVNITTRANRKLSVTPNHPILTTRGWVLAGEVVESDDLICARLLDGHGSGVPDVNDAPPTIEQVFESGSFFDSSALDGMPPTTKYLYGEMFPDCDVKVVDPLGLLERAFKSSGLKPTEHESLAFARGSGAVVGEPLDRDGALDLLLDGGDSSLRSAMGRLCLSCPLFMSHFGCPDKTSIGTSAHSDSRFSKPSSDGGTADSEPVGDGVDALSVLERFDNAVWHVEPLASRLDAIALESAIDGRLPDSKSTRNLAGAFPSLIEVDDVLSVVVTEGTCHVYNLSTKGGWYLSSGIITHNCDCRIVPSFDGSGVEGYDSDSYADYWRDANRARVSGEIPDEVKERIASARARARADGKPWSDDLNGTEIVMRWMYGMK